jgi:hypothetical protein
VPTSFANASTICGPPWRRWRRGDEEGVPSLRLWRRVLTLAEENQAQIHQPIPMERQRDDRGPAGRGQSQDARGVLVPSNHQIEL